jgi:hypothetical protein
LDYSIHEGPFPAKPISGSYKGSSSGGSSAGGSGSGSRSAGFNGAFANKQRRADYNAWRRSGDWFALNTLSVLLWMDDTLCSEDDPAYPLPGSDLWS